MTTTIRKPVVPDGWNDPIVTEDITSAEVERQIDEAHARIAKLVVHAADLGPTLLAGYTVLLEGLDQRRDRVRFGPGHALKVLSSLDSTLTVAERRAVEADDARA